ncbi:hypothetical protein BsIDN1_48440 [Bacillus safensis]|uniref:Uncharacterized protein n=1 Tax=Bacillus safensis TaxID=561879 RepID=A0A5S9MHX3_BACIA|nr:hypothetical protein BsIDN1_48440 [Bacillus safensis]
MVVQHADNSYSWYGQLKKADVALYDFVDKGEKKIARFRLMIKGRARIILPLSKMNNLSILFR